MRGKMDIFKIVLTSCVVAVTIFIGILCQNLIKMSDKINNLIDKPPELIQKATEIGKNVEKMTSGNLNFSLGVFNGKISSDKT
jgi:hypothetical protein